MQSSTAYLEFRRQFSSLQSKARVSNLVSVAATWARNLPVSAEVNAATLVARVARVQGFDMNADEAAQAAHQLETALNIVHH